MHTINDSFIGEKTEVIDINKSERITGKEKS